MITEDLPICPLCDKLYEPKDYISNTDICLECEKININGMYDKYIEKENELADYYGWQGDKRYEE